MAYKYFAKQLINSDLDLNEVFHSKQNLAREQGGVSYGLQDIVLYLKDKTSNFTVSDKTYIELDQVIEEIVNRYYKSINQTNPFKLTKKVQQEFEEGVVPREAAEVEEGKVKGRGVVKPSPKVKPAAEEEPVKEISADAEAQTKEAVKAVDSVIQADKELTAKIEKLKKDLTGAQFFIDDEDSTPEDKDVMLSQIKKKLKSTEELIEDGDDSEYVVQTRDLLKDFIAKNTK